MKYAAFRTFGKVLTGFAVLLIIVAIVLFGDRFLSGAALVFADTLFYLAFAVLLLFCSQLTPVIADIAENLAAKRVS